jgi:ubiquinone/menaquinone biosynthesis C-methylase UbiE
MLQTWQMPDLEFRRDLYSGTAADYDRFRVPYPKALTDDLAERSGATGAGRLLDLACGTGQITFALHDRYAEVWAVDQEPDMVHLVAEKAAAIGATNIRPDVSAAERLSAPAGSFDLIAMGNAFHRLPRRAVAASALRWLRPGGLLALLWGGSPWPGTEGWQLAMSATKDRWTARACAADRVPAEYGRERAATPDAAVLSDCGFEQIGRYTFMADHDWTAEELIGYLYSTSVLSRAALGGLAAVFEHDVRRELAACDPGGRFHQVIDFAYDLFRKP